MKKYYIIYNIRSSHLLCILVYTCISYIHTINKIIITYNKLHINKKIKIFKKHTIIIYIRIMNYISLNN